MQNTGRDKKYRINEGIRYPQLRVITDEGENLGVLATRDALTKAREKELDLVVITESANPPVAKILDFNKFLYETNKKASQIKAKAKKSKLKELVFGPNVSQDTLMQKVGRAKEFLEEGNRVRVTIELKGRQKAYPQFAFEKLEKFAKELEELARLEEPIKGLGSKVAVTFIKK